MSVSLVTDSFILYDYNGFAGYQCQKPFYVYIDTAFVYMK